MNADSLVRTHVLILFPTPADILHLPNAIWLESIVFPLVNLLGVIEDCLCWIGFCSWCCNIIPWRVHVWKARKGALKEEKYGTLQKWQGRHGVIPKWGEAFKKFSSKSKEKENERGQKIGAEFVRKGKRGKTKGLNPIILIGMARKMKF